MSKGDPCCGTSEGASIWFNYADTLGLVCSFFVWLSIVFAAVCSGLFYQQGYFNLAEEIIVVLLVGMALTSHLMVMFSDPGAVPKTAQPASRDRSIPYTMCGRCDAFKPPKSHHDRVSNRCIARMDHYCPWTNNAIGAGNQKMFILFIIYTDVAALYFYYLIAIRLAFCNGENCRAFTGSSLLLARILLFVLLFAVLFTTSMVLNQIYGLATGLGTIDRLKLKRGDYYTEEPVPIRNVFGAKTLEYCIPTIPTFQNKAEVFGYKDTAESIYDAA